MGNSDPILKLLKDFAYAVVRLPRQSIQPLQVIEKQGNELTILGQLSDLFSSGLASLPTVGPDQQAPFINGKRTRALDINVGLSLLGGIVGAMSGTKLKLDAGYKKASNLTFEFDDVQVNDVNQLALNKFLSGAKVDQAVGQGILKALDEDRLYVITATIKSKKFKTEANQSSGSSAAVDVPVIQEIAGGTVQIKSEGASDSKVTFEGTTPLVFGFQAARMEFERGVFKGLKQSAPEGGALRGLPSEPKFELLEIDGPFANLVEAPGKRAKNAKAAKATGRRSKR